MDNFIRGFITVLRYLLPVLSVLMMSLCTVGLLKKRVKPYKLTLLSEGFKGVPLFSGEYIIGSAKECDIVVEDIDEQHAVLSVSNNYMTIRPIGKSKIGINKKSIRDEKRFTPDDLINIGDREFIVNLKSSRAKPTGSQSIKKAVSFALLNLIQFFVLISLCFAYKDKTGVLFLCFGALMIGEWVYMIITRFLGVFLEVPVLYMLTLGLSVAVHSGVSSIIKQLVCFAFGFVCAVFLAKLMEKTKAAMGFKSVALIVGVALFVINILFGVIYNGSQNWIDINGISFQPSEFIKIVLVYLAGAVADKMTDKKDIVLFSLFSVFSLIVLAYLSDFGTVLIYGVTFAIMLFIRLCNFKLLGIMTGTFALCGVLVAVVFPYVAKRVFSFGSAFEHAADSGYQQTRTMIAVASGGLFGVGGGKGTLVKIPAYDTDIVFGLIVEEWGLIIGLCILFTFVLLALYAVKSLTVSSSKLYGITCCAAAVLMLTQASLNVFGSLDMLPFTGVTLPFISNGGSSIISCTVLMAFFRVALRDETVILKERRRKVAKA